MRLEERRVENPPRIVDVVLLLVAAAVLEQRPFAQAASEAPARIERLVVALDRGAAAVGVVVAGARVVLEGETHPVRAAVQARQRVVGAAVGAVVVARAPAELEGAAREGGLERIGADGGQRTRAPRQRVGAPHDLQRLQRVRTDVAQRGIHARRAGGKRAGAVHEHADLFRVQPADRRIEVDGAAPQGSDAGVIAQRLGQILGHAAFELIRGDDQPVRYLRHQRRHGDLLRERADLEGERGGDAARCDGNGFRVGLEPEQCGAQHVVAGGDGRQLEPAGAVRRRRRDEAAIESSEHDRCAGQGQLLGIGHHAGDRGAVPGLQGRRRDRDGKQESERGREPHPDGAAVHFGNTSARCRTSSTRARSPRGRGGWHARTWDSGKGTIRSGPRQARGGGEGGA